MRHLRTLPVLIAVLAVWCAVTAAVPPGEPAGEAALSFALARLPVTGSVLHVAAHPDDEDTALLAWLARGRGLRAAYLSATRGEGGQNLLGPEQYEALGLLRTQELLAARKLDGAEQFFSRAFDFGFSKDSAETLEKWGHEATLSDFVRVIRRFRPDVIVSRFAGGPQDGHGQHAAAGILAREAFKAAADPTRFPEQIKEGLPPWQARKFYIEVNRFGPSANQPPPAGATAVDLGEYSAVLGRSYVELAMEGRSLHRSQAMGVPQRKGPWRQYFLLTESVLPGDLKEQRAKEHDLLDGVEARLANGPLLAQIDKANDAFRNGDTPGLIAALTHGLELARQLPPALRAVKERQFAEALALAHGAAVEALADREEAVPGEDMRVTVTAWNRAKVPLEVREVSLVTPAGWQTKPVDWKPGALEYNQNSARSFTLSVPSDAPVSQPYWLVKPLAGQTELNVPWQMPPRNGDAYQVAEPPLIGLPENPPLIVARLQLVSAGVPWTIEAPVQHRRIDPLYGQRDEDIVVVPKLAAWMEPRLVMFPPSQARRVTIRVQNNTHGEQTGWFASTTHPSKLPRQAESGQPAAGKAGEAGSFGCGATAPWPGWKDTTPSRFGCAGVVAPQAELTKQETLRAPRPGTFGTYRFGAEETTAVGPTLITYPHIQTQYWFRPAETWQVPVEANLPPNVRVGYVMGAGDEVPESLRQLGAAVQLLNAEDLASGDLSRFNAIVTGIRAYAVRKDLVANNARLLDYVKNGGVMIVQYDSDWPGRQAGGQFSYGPYPMAQANRRAPRVAREEEPVRILVPDDPLFNTPNRITDKDFEGWVQERGLYFMSEWDSHYTPLLESHDPGEPEQKGGMLAARFGKGLYVYTAYAWFRQLPAGVPGAYRIWANLLAAGQKP